MHKKRFLELIACDNTSEGDFERYQLFYTIACTDALYRRVNNIYDFENHQIKQTAIDSCQDSTDYDDMMLKRSIHLYNSYRYEDISTATLLDKLDSSNCRTVINAQLIYSRICDVSDIF